MSEPKYITMHHRFYALFKCHEANQKSWSMTSSNRRWSITSIYAGAELELFVRGAIINIIKYNIYFTLLYMSCKKKPV
jgi:hypothetical protein